MEFLDLTIENFLSVEREKVRLDNRGVLLISGENGAGKSSLTSKAISWVLFGQTGQRGVKGDAVANFVNRTDLCSVEVRLRVAGKIHTIRRQRNPSSIEVDNIRFRVPAETQRLVEQLIGRDLNSFVATDYFGQDRPLDFLGMTPTAQMESMEGILRLSRLDELVAGAKAKGAVEREIVERQTQDTRQWEGQLQELERQQAHANDRHATLQRRMETRQIHRVDLDAAEVNLRRDVLKGPVGAARQERHRLETSLNVAEEKLKALREDETTERNRAMYLRNEVANYRARFRDIEDAVCPICKGPVDHDLTAQLRIEQEQVRRSHQVAFEQQMRIDQRIASIRHDRGAVEDRVRELGDQLNARQLTILKFDEELAKIDQYREVLKQADLHDQAVQGELIAMVDLMTAQHSTLRSALSTSAYAQQQAMNRLSMLNYWMEVFGRTFKNLILEQALPFLQERSGYHLRLLENPELKVSFSTQKTLKTGEERHQLTVVACRDQGGQSEMALSGGERQMVSFAVGLALSELADSQTGSPSNLMILDEPFTMLDEGNCESVVQYVTTELVKRKATILLISNDERMKALIPGGLHVRRGEDGKSRIDGARIDSGR